MEVVEHHTTDVGAAASGAAADVAAAAAVEEGVCAERALSAGVRHVRGQSSVVVGVKVDASDKDATGGRQDRSS